MGRACVTPKEGSLWSGDLNPAHSFSGWANGPKAWGRLAPGSLLPADPTCPAADLFDILLPMLNIYQEFVRNHQYSLQILAHCKQNRDFDKLLKQYEAKPDCEERTLETFLTYPMFQVAAMTFTGAGWGGGTEGSPGRTQSPTTPAGGEPADHACTCPLQQWGR